MPKAGFVATVGRPNVGKSTLINTLLGQKIAAVSPRPQTTRRRQLGILSLPEGQIVFIDTPGMHVPKDKLGEFMNQEASQALEDADVLCWIVDASAPPHAEDELISQRLNAFRPLPPTLLALNKADLLPKAQSTERLDAYHALLPEADAIWISAIAGIGLNELVSAILEKLPEGEPLYDEDQVTDYSEREIAAELIREAAMRCLREEVPYSLAVRIDEYKERSDGTAYIHATLLVEREGQKGIVIGEGGKMLKRIGTLAREEIQAMSDRKVFLELNVKVSKNWRTDPFVMRSLGYRLGTKAS